MSDFARVRKDLTGIRATLASATSVKTAGVATFVINGVETSVQVARDLTLAVGDVCLVQRFGSAWFAIQRFYTGVPAVVESVAPPPPRPTVVSGKLVVSPVETRSYRSSTWVGWRFDNDDIYQ